MLEKQTALSLGNCLTYRNFSKTPGDLRVLQYLPGPELRPVDKVHLMECGF